MKQILTIQHCESIHHTNGMVGSWTDWDLTERGRRQAQNIADNLAPELLGQSVKIYSSDLKRAAQTAAPLAEKLGLEIEFRQELRERNLGEAVGKSAQWYREHRGPERPGDYIDVRPFPSAETEREVYQRLEPLCREVLDRDVSRRHAGRVEPPLAGPAAGSHEPLRHPDKGRGCGAV